MHCPHSAQLLYWPEAWRIDAAVDDAMRRTETSCAHAEGIGRAPQRLLMILAINSTNLLLSVQPLLQTRKEAEKQRYANISVVKLAND